jgi:hypothetical protein
MPRPHLCQSLMSPPTTSGRAICRMPLWDWELVTPSAAEHERLLARLRRALRLERQRGLSGHWTYDLARHAQLLRAYRAEVAACLKAREGAATAAPSR